MYFRELQKKVKIEKAMDWLFDQGIVFDLLPDDRTVKRIATSDTKIQTLGCLTYLENEPQKENIALLNVVLTFLVAAFGGVGALVVNNILGFQAAINFALLGVLVLLWYLLKISKKNAHGA